MDPKKIKESLFLPKTNFPLKITNIWANEKKIWGEWEKKQIYQKILTSNQKNPSFILHSGPTYANGKIHLGHVLNSIIKDIIVRFQASQGKYTPFWLGWDAHGLPVEHKVLQIYPQQKTDLRQTCYQFACEQAQLQKEQLKKLGLFTDYGKSYITLNKEYEAEQIRIFGDLVRKGLIYRDFRPIHWSWSHETALAENEIEYYKKKDLSLYFKVRINPDQAEKKWKRREVNFLIWTTQPWTIPANQLIAVKKNASYALVNFSNEYLIILEKKISLLEKLKKEGVKVEKVFPGQELLGLNYFRPYHQNSGGWVVDGEEFVQEKEGTGLVHLAPAFGAEDFILAKKEKIKISCPLEPNGCFNEKIGIPELVSKHYSAVNNYIIADLEKKNLVVKKEEITHNYPHDWRDKSPLIYRLTEQWFIRVEALKKELLANVEKVQWHPSWTKEKMQSIILTREDWCISRQRQWGVPIPILYDQGQPLLDSDLIDYIAELISQFGSSCWFTETILPRLRTKFPQLIKEKTQLGTDIMDVWLDSGISHWCVLKKRLV